MTSHFEESTIKGNLATSGSLASNCRKRVIAVDAVDHALVHADVEDIRPVLDLLPGHAYRFLVFALLDQLRELGRSGHIGPLADHDVDAGLLGKWL